MNKYLSYVDDEKNMTFSNWCSVVDDFYALENCPPELFERFKSVVRELADIWNVQTEREN